MVVVVVVVEGRDGCGATRCLCPSKDGPLIVWVAKAPTPDPPPATHHVVIYSELNP